MSDVMSADEMVRKVVNAYNCLIKNTQFYKIDSNYERNIRLKKSSVVFCNFDGYT